METADILQEPSKTQTNRSFIEANTQDVSLSHLTHDCIIPVFSKDNETTIAHHEFIHSILESAQQVFPKEAINEPEIRISHVIKGRIPEAIGKPVKELLEHEKTIYYERMAFTIELPSIRNTINGNELLLTIGGVRAYNQENLYSRKSMEKFKIFIGFKNLVCLNMCISSDGYVEELRASNINEIISQTSQVFQSYDIARELTSLDGFADYELTQHQFCQFIGRSRLYHFLPKVEKKELPYLSLNDGQLSSVTRAYYEDESFASSTNGNINLWKLYNLFTGAVKSSYIDNFLDRTVNAHQLTIGMIHALNGHGGYKWFLS